MVVPETLPREMKIAISGRGHYYLRKLASHKYYQTRVGEDTVWYNEVAVNKYIVCLRESIQAQLPGSDDVLQATEAREIFLSYLKKSLLEEIQTSNIRFTTADWPRLMNDIVERSVFGQTITWTNYVSEDEAVLALKELIRETIMETMAKATDEKKFLRVNEDGESQTLQD